MKYGDARSKLEPQQSVLKRGWSRVVNKVKGEFHQRYARKEKESTADRAARLTANSTVLIAVFTVVLALVGVLTLVEVVQGGADTTAIAQAAKQQACAARQIAAASERNAAAAESFSSTAGLINGNVDDAVKKLDAQAKATEASRKASVQNAQVALQATIDNFHQEQRAWVGITQLNSVVDKSINSDQVLDAKGRGTPAIQEMFGVTNTGRVPAQDVRLESCLYLREKNYVPGILDAQWMERIIDAKVNGTLEGVKIIDGRNDPHRPVPKHWMNFLFDATLVPPGQTAFNDTIDEVFLGSLSPEIVFATPLGTSSIIANPGTKILFGEITYTDLFSQQKRVTKFCVYSSFRTGRFGACPVFNNMQ